MAQMSTEFPVFTSCNSPSPSATDVAVFERKQLLQYEQGTSGAKTQDRARNACKPHQNPKANDYELRIQPRQEQGSLLTCRTVAQVNSCENMQLGRHNTHIQHTKQNKAKRTSMKKKQTMSVIFKQT